MSTPTPEMEARWLADWNHLNEGLPKDKRLDWMSREVHRAAWFMGYAKGMQFAKDHLIEGLRQLGVYPR